LGVGLRIGDRREFGAMLDGKLGKPRDVPTPGQRDHLVC
jgi:hypothetical protein